jgi:hypothetical protein
MKLSELQNYLLINSNQHFIGSDNIEITNEILLGLVSRAISLFSQYRPEIYYTRITVTMGSPLKLKQIDGKNVQSVLDLYVVNPLLNDGESARVPFKWNYDKPSKNLVSMFSGTYYAKVLCDVSLDDINYTDIEFLNIILAQYLQYLGELRNSFKFDDLPIDTNAEVLISNGKDLLEKTLETLSTDHGRWSLPLN